MVGGDGAVVRLADLIDLEARIALDRDVDEESLRARDREIFARLDPSASREALLVDWLAALRERDPGPQLGARVSAGLRWASRVLVGVGLLAGWGTAAALLAYREGGPPVNVGTYLFVVVGLQLGLLLLFALAYPISSAFPDAPLVGDVRRLWRGLARALERLSASAETRLDPETRSKLASARSRLRSRASLYRPVERWTLVGLSQTFGVAFNVGLLAACLRLVVLSDIAFGWSTTADALSASRMTAIVQTLSTPWASAWPEAAPTRELVEDTRYFRLEGRYAAAPPGAKGDPRRAGAWWPFLFACTVTYGLFPRVLLALGAAFGRARALSSLPLDRPEIARILRRLQAPRVETRAAAEPESPGRLSANPGAAGSPLPTSGPGVVIRWRDAEAPDDLLRGVLRHRYGWEVDRLLDATGDPAADAAALEPLSDDVAVGVVVESWEPPDKGIRRWLADLRGRLGAERPLWVLLIGGVRAGDFVPAAPRDVAVWRDRLDLLEDPQLGVEPLEAA